MVDYQHLWDTMTVNPGKVTAISALVARIQVNKSRYQTVVNAMSVPWQVVAVIHYREANFSFLHHLHNGDPLTARTVHVPAGRPKTGTPPFTWEYSAQDALVYEGFDKVDLWDIPSMLFHLEAYNGMGYQRRGINRPYLWSFTNLYDKGKYSSDHGFDPDLVDQEAGCAPLLIQIL